MICDWIKKDEQRCTREAKATFSLCPQHLETQKKIQQQSIQNAKYLSPKISVLGKPNIETSGLDQLEAATIEGGEGALIIFNRDPSLSYKWARDKNTAIARSLARGFRFVEGCSGQSSSRPVAGQSEGTVKNQGMTLENQVGKDGRIRVGDLVLMAMPKSQRHAQIKAAENESRRKATGVIEGKSSQGEIDKISGAEHKPFEVPGYIKEKFAESQPSIKKSYSVPAQIG